MERFDDSSGKYILGTVSQTLKLIEHLADNEYATLTQISQALGMNKTVAYRHLCTLQNQGFVYRTSSATYTLGHRFVFIGQKVQRLNTLHQTVKGVLGKLTAKFNETSHMGILNEECQLLIVSKVNADAAMQMTSDVGRTLPAYCSAMGKCLLAYSDVEYIERYFKSNTLVRWTTNTLVTREQLLNDFIQIRKKSYSLDNEESEDGLFCLACPVADYSGRVYSAISISGPISRMSGKYVQMIEELKGCAAEISSLIGPSRP